MGTLTSHPYTLFSKKKTLNATVHATKLTFIFFWHFHCNKSRDVACERPGVLQAPGIYKHLPEILHITHF